MYILSFLSKIIITKKNNKKSQKNFNIYEGKNILTSKKQDSKILVII